MPTITSARLIQSIQQSDMRVGMNSTEFGNISIHTSTAQGVISSEITLAHVELAKAISAHLPSPQDQAASSQSMSVRVENNSGTSSTMGGSAQGGQADQPQGSTRRNPQSRDTDLQPWVEQSKPFAARSSVSYSGRLDVRV
jgi:hypothetical protein